MPSKLFFWWYSKRAQCIHNQSAWGKGSSPADSSGAPCRAQCVGAVGRSLPAVPQMSCDQSPFCLPEWNPEVPAWRETSFQLLIRRRDQSSCFSCAQSFLFYNSPWVALGRAGGLSRGKDGVWCGLWHCWAALRIPFCFPNMCTVLSLLTPLGRSPSALTVCPPSVCVCFHLR
jgi:hypothetical protein